jgi:hypothetical protein
MPMTKTLENLIESTQKELNSMTATEADKVAQEIRLNGTVRISQKKAKEFPGWAIFKNRALEAGLSENASIALWRPTVQVLRMGSHIAQTKDDSGKHKAQVTEYEKEARQELRKVLLPAMKRLFPEGEKYAFWSGLEHVAREYASSMKYKSLETTSLGSFFNGLKFFTGEMFPSDWDAVKPLWLELSLAYAKNVSGEVHIFARWKGGIFKQVERPNVPKDVSFKWHALTPLLEVEPIELYGEIKPDCKGPKHVKDASGAEGTTESNWKVQIDAGLEAWRKHHNIEEKKD